MLSVLHVRLSHSYVSTHLQRDLGRGSEVPSPTSGRRRWSPMGSTFLASERHKTHSWGQIWGQLERDSGAPAGKCLSECLPQSLEKKVARGRSTSWSRWTERGASIQPLEFIPLRVNRQSMRGLAYTFPRKQIRPAAIDLELLLRLFEALERLTHAFVRSPPPL